MRTTEPASDGLRRGHVKRRGFRGQDQQRSLDGIPAEADGEFSRLLARKWIRHHFKQDTRLAVARNDRRRHLQSGAAAGNAQFHLIGGGCGIQADFTYRAFAASHNVLAAGERYRPDAPNRDGFDGGVIAGEYSERGNLVMIGDQGLNRKLGIGLSLGNCDGSRRPETVTGGFQLCRSSAGGCRQRKGYLARAGGTGRRTGRNGYGACVLTRVLDCDSRALFHRSECGLNDGPSAQSRGCRKERGSAD